MLLYIAFYAISYYHLVQKDNGVCVYITYAKKERKKTLYVSFILARIRLLISRLLGTPCAREWKNCKLCGKLLKARNNAASFHLF